MKRRSKTIQVGPLAIFGALCEDEIKVSPILRRFLRTRIKGAELLPFQVESQDLKNTVACMQLMDITGLLVLGGHRNLIWRHLPRLDSVARLSRTVDTVARKGRNMVGHNALGLACLKWAKKKISPKRGSKPVALIAGMAPEIPSVGAALLTAGWNVIHYRAAGTKQSFPLKGIKHVTKTSSLPLNTHLLVAGQMAKSGAQKLAQALKGASSLSAVLDLRDRARVVKFPGKIRLGRRELQGLFYLTCANILTSAKPHNLLKFKYTF